MSQENQIQLSLLDYLGRPAGPDLGLKVAKAAKQAEVAMSTREVKTRKYTGQILVYPKYFLDAYFILNPQDRPYEFTIN